jgi:hypothetical protein
MVLPRGLDNARLLKNKIYIITNTIMHNSIIQKLGVLYLEIKLLKESEIKFDQENSEYKSFDHIMNVLDDALIYLIHMILSYNYETMRKYLESCHEYDLPKIYDTINPNLVIDLSLILSKINDNINESFYMFDPKIEFNKYGREIIPEHYEIFYSHGSIVRNFRKFNEIKEIDNKFCCHNYTVLLNKKDPLKNITDMIDDIIKLF